MITQLNKRDCLAVVTLALLAHCTPAAADPAASSGIPAPRVCSTIDWSRLSLTTQQSQQIQTLEGEWCSKYAKMQPDIQRQQTKLKQLFADPKSNPVDVMQTQQTLSRLQEQLRNEAMTNYLRKRAFLNESQQQQLEAQLQQMMVDRQRGTAKAKPMDQPTGIDNLIQKIRWAIEPH